MNEIANWEGKDRQVWGLLYTHHKVPDTVLAATLASIRAAGLPDERLLICCQFPDVRLPMKARKVFFTPTDTHWIPAIYSQIIAGLQALPPDAWVLTLEHDILYPGTYVDVMSEAMREPNMAYYYTLVRHLDVRPGYRTDFWASDGNGTRTLQSCCGGLVSTLLRFAYTDLSAYRMGTLNKDFELGVTPGNWCRVDADHPVLDIRCGTNTSNTGYDKQIYFASESDAYWGKAAHLRKRLGFSDGV